LYQYFPDLYHSSYGIQRRDLILDTNNIIMPKQLRERAGSQSAFVYFVAFIGALIYFIGHAATFGMGVLGFLKAIVWPAILCYKLLEFLKV